ncbi:MAG TPA: PEP-CTERM sorting domain-containing protein, partial [Lacipirellulaceae bacterium]
AFCVGIFAIAGAVSAQTLRVAAYNVDADTPSGGGPDAGPGLTTVLQAIGNAHLAGHTQPLDVLALEELYGDPTVTMGFIVDQLNGIYGPGTYAYDATPDLTNGNFLTGNGPSGLVYNTHSVQVLGATYIGTASGTGAPRAPMRYTLAPIGYNDHSADFTIYVSHAKANSGSGDNVGRRNFEAVEIRDDAATLGANAHIIYSGDLNILSSSEAAYKTLISSTVDAGVGKAVDTLNPTNNWNTSPSLSKLYTESADSLSARFDFQLVTSPMLIQPGMQLVPNTLGAFGNNGTVSDVSDPSTTNTALADLGVSPYTPAYRTLVLNDLVNTTDHLPIVADYSFASAVGIPGDYDHSGLVDTADYNLWKIAFGSTTSLAADGNHDGTVNATDYIIWRDHLGTHTPGAGAGALAAVPEPSSVLLLILGGCLAGLVAGKLRG